MKGRNSCADKQRKATPTKNLTQAKRKCQARRKSNFLTAAVAVCYWAATWFLGWLMFGTDVTMFMGETLSMYYIAFSIIPLAALFALSPYGSPTEMTWPRRLACTVFAILVAGNIAMAFDGLMFPYQFTMLNQVDMVIHGDPNNLMPFGVSDIIIAGIILVCIYGCICSRE